MSLSSVESAGGLRSPDMSTPSPGPGWWMDLLPIIAWKANRNWLQVHREAR